MVTNRLRDNYGCRCWLVLYHYHIRILCNLKKTCSALTIKRKTFSFVAIQLCLHKACLLYPFHTKLLVCILFAQTLCSSNPSYFSFSWNNRIQQYSNIIVYIHTCTHACQYWPQHKLYLLLLLHWWWLSWWAVLWSYMCAASLRWMWLVPWLMWCLTDAVVLWSRVIPWYCFLFLAFQKILIQNVILVSGTKTKKYYTNMQISAL